MQKSLCLFAFILFISCGNNEIKKEEQVKESNTEEVKQESGETIPATVKVSAEDSVEFYSALNEEREITTKFCECAEKKGRTHKDCREFQRTQHLANRQTEVLNKYYNMENYDKAAIKRMSDAMNEVMNMFNECGE